MNLTSTFSDIWQEPVLLLLIMIYHHEPSYTEHENEPLLTFLIAADMSKYHGKRFALAFPVCAAKLHDPLPASGGPWKQCRNPLGNTLIVSYEPFKTLYWLLDVNQTIRFNLWISVDDISLQILEAVGKLPTITGAHHCGVGLLKLKGDVSCSSTLFLHQIHEAHRGTPRH